MSTDITQVDVLSETVSPALSLCAFSSGKEQQVFNLRSVGETLPKALQFSINLNLQKGACLEAPS